LQSYDRQHLLDAMIQGEAAKACTLQSTAGAQSLINYKDNVSLPLVLRSTETACYHYRHTTSSFSYVGMIT
jgi:hypothetical protein